MPELIDALVKELLPALQEAQGRQYGLGSKEWLAGQKHDASGNPITTGYLHGPGGVLTFPGVDNDVFHTIVGPLGILGSLPTKGSVYTDPTYQVITGVTGDTGTEKIAVCDNAPHGGLIKACKLTAPFGRYERATPELELNRLGMANDRADPMDLRLIGSPVAQAGIFASGPANPRQPADLLTNEISAKFWQLAISFQRLLNRQLWNGNPGNNTGGGGYKEFPGFNLLVNTGYADIETGTTCPSVDSDLKNFGFQRVESNPDSLIDMLSYMLKTRRDLAERTGVTPVRWVLGMRQELFWEITAIWPCSYLTYRCQVQGNESVNVDARDAVRFRDEMRAGRYLLVDGEKIDVLLDDGIMEANANNQGALDPGVFASDIFLIPMSVLGGQAVTFLEYADYSNPSLRAALGDNLILARAEGAFLTWPRQTNQCVQWQSKTELRLVLRTPWLAGRIQNVAYSPLQHSRQSDPTDDYFINGGVTGRSGPSYVHTLW